MAALTEETIYKLEESVRFYSNELGLCADYVLGTLRATRWCADKLPQDVPFCKGDCGHKHGKIQLLKDTILKGTGVCSYKEIHGADCPKCAANTCPCARTREEADKRARTVGICLLGESNYDNTREAREAYIAKEKAKLAKASKTVAEVAASAGAEPEAESPTAGILQLAEFLPPQEWTPAQQDALLRAAAFLFHQQFMAAQVGPIWDAEFEDFQEEEKLLEQYYAAEEQRDAEEAALEAAAAKKAAAMPARNWAALAAGGGAKPQVVVKAPAKKPPAANGGPQRGSLTDLHDVADLSWADEMFGF